MRANGPDISWWQGHPAWDFTAFDFCICKTSEADFGDARFSVYWDVLRRSGKPRGSYHFYRSRVSGASQASLAMKTLGDDIGDFVVLDFEVLDGAAPKSCALSAKTYCSTIKKLGIPVLIYTAPGFLAQFAPVDIEWMQEYELWLASYWWEKRPDFIQNFSGYLQQAQTTQPKVPAPFKTWRFWQWTGHGRLSGFTGDVDLNVYNGTPDDLKMWLNKPVTPPQPTVCRWCGSNAFDDRRGNCGACGGTREYPTHGVPKLANFWWPGGFPGFQESEDK